MTTHPFSLHHLIFLLLSSLQPISTTYFTFNGFNSSDILLFGISTLQSHTLTLTNSSSFSMGRAFYPSKITTRAQNTSNLLPFSTSFIFSMTPFKNSLPGHGLVFLFSPFPGMEGGSSAQHLGLFNRTNDGNLDNHVFGIEFDVFENQEFNDIDDNHVGVDVNSLTSIASHGAGYWSDSDHGGSSSAFKKLKLNNGVNYQVWIDYKDFWLNVTMARAGLKRPRKPLISIWLNLSDVFLDEMYVGFCAATGRLIESHRILAWSFSNSNMFVGGELITSNLPSFLPLGSSVFRSKGFIAGIVVAIVFLICCGVAVWLILDKRKRRHMREREDLEDWELEYWPHRVM